MLRFWHHNISVTYFHIRALYIVMPSLASLASRRFFIIRCNIAIAEPRIALFFDVFFMQFIFGYVFPYTRTEHRVGEHKTTCILVFFYCINSFQHCYCRDSFTLFFDVFSCNIHFNIFQCRAQDYLCLGVFLC